MASAVNRFHLAVSGDNDFPLTDDEGNQLIPGVEKIFHLGAEVADLTDLAQDQRCVNVTPGEAARWPLMYDLLSASMKRLQEQEAEEREMFAKKMAEIDRRRQEAWARYEEISNVIKENRQ